MQPVSSCAQCVSVCTTGSPALSSASKTPSSCVSPLLKARTGQHLSYEQFAARMNKDENILPHD